MPLPGQSLRDRYLLKRELGRGGMGEVYLAFDAFLQREVAVKFTRLALFDDPEIGNRSKKLWLNETRLAGKLHHPHIVEIYEAGASDEHVFLVMEYVDGHALQRHAAPDQLLAPGAVAEILFKVANALDYASRLGLLHRDIKPANVLLAHAGGLKLTDFGACYFTNVEDTQVYDVGTLPYMPPEHFQSRPPSVQSDIYALGVTAYQLLTGRLPFSGETFQALIYEKLNRDFVPLETRRADLPGELRFLVHRAMHRDTGMRHASWPEFCDDLARAMPEADRPREVVFESARFTALRGVPLLAEISDAQLWELVHISRSVEKREGETIFDAGDAGDRIYAVVRGTVVIRRDNTDLNTVRAGECFGEIAYLDESDPRRTATAVAASHAVLIEIPAQSLRNASAGLQAGLLKTLVRVMIGRLKQADARFLEALGR